MTKKLDAISCMPAFSSEIKPKRVEYQGKNLVDVVASNTNKFVTACMKILLTENELATGYIIDGPSTSTRKPLDLNKFQLLLGKQFF